MKRAKTPSSKGPASRSEADYNFVSNEIYVTFSMTARVEPIRRWGFVPLHRKKPRRSVSAGLSRHAVRVGGIDTRVRQISEEVTSVDGRASRLPRSIRGIPQARMSAAAEATAQPAPIVGLWSHRSTT